MKTNRRGRTATAGTLLGCLVLLAGTGAVRADGSSDEAKKHFFAGQAFYEVGRYDEAISEFKAAHDIKAHPAFLYNIAVAYKMKSDWAAAIDYLEKYVAVVTEPAERDRAKAMIEELRKLLTAAPPTSGPAVVPTPGEPTPTPKKPAKKEETKKILEVVSTPPGAALWLDRKEGDPKTRTPAILEMAAGEHAVFLDLEEYGPVTRKVTLDPGKPWVVLDITLVKKEALGFVTILSDQPGTTVFLDTRDGGSVGITPYKDWMAIGRHHLWLEKEGYDTIEVDIDIKSGDTPTFKYDMKIANYGRLEVVANVAGTRVEVDGTVIASLPGPTPPPKVATGAHKLKVYAPGHKPWKVDVPIENGKTLRLKVDLVKRPSIVGPIVLFAIGVGFGITGTIFASGAKRNIEALEDEVGALDLVDAADPRLRKARVHAIVGDAGWGLGLLFVIAGVIDLVTDDTPPSTGKIVGSTFADAARRFGAAPVTGGGLVTWRGEF